VTIPRDPQFGRQLDTWRERIEVELERRLPPTTSHPGRLHEAMRYCVLGAGKRIRPALVYATACTLGLSESVVDDAACAIEFIHAYSLVHDDLPAMDDDDLRRGRPTCHKAFDEATAILVGDALQVLAFQMLARESGLPRDAQTRLRLVELLAVASGTAGMAGGQALDLDANGRQLTLAQVEEMHGRKTGALIHASVMMPAACVTDLSDSVRRALDSYARDLGFAFQIQDDLLDIEGDANVLGKATGADAQHGKPTYPAVAGVEAARTKMMALHARALESLETIGPAASPLAALCDWLVLRKH
jgi:farnesyl diphosphate synthase